MLCSIWIKVELDLNGKMCYSEKVLEVEVPNKINHFKEVAERRTEEYAIFVRRKSKVNNLIKNMKDETEINL